MHVQAAYISYTNQTPDATQLPIVTLSQTEMVGYHIRVLLSVVFTILSNRLLWIVPCWKPQFQMLILQANRSFSLNTEFTEETVGVLFFCSVNTRLRPKITKRTHHWRQFVVPICNVCKKWWAVRCSVDPEEAKREIFTEASSPTIILGEL